MQSESPPIPADRQASLNKTDLGSDLSLARILGHIVVSVDLCSPEGQEDLPMLSFKPPCMSFTVTRLKCTKS
jgi:hypothetical protein